MSTAAKFKELTEAAAAATAKIADLEAKLASAEAQNKQLSDDLAAAQKAGAEAAKERDAAAKLNETSYTEWAGVQHAAESQIADLTAKLTAATTKLENPAYSDASMAATDKPLGGGTEASDPRAGMPTWKRYYAITDPAERTKFYEANRAKLIGEAQVGVGV